MTTSSYRTAPGDAWLIGTCSILPKFSTSVFLLVFVLFGDQGYALVDNNTDQPSDSPGSFI